MINKLKNDNLKYFLYKFFIVWNAFVILLLIFINLEIKPVKLKHTQEEFGQIKLIWKNRPQNDFKDVQKIEFLDNKYLLSFNKDNIIAYRINNGNVFFNMTADTNIIGFQTLNNKFVVVKKDGELFFYDRFLNKYNENKLTLNGLVSIAGRFYSDLLLYDADKLYLIGKKANMIIDVARSIVSVNYNTDFNNDKINDILAGSTNSVVCIDGKTGKFLWDRNTGIITNIILNSFSSKKDRYIIIKNNREITVLNKFGLKIGVLKLDAEVKFIKPVSFLKKEYLIAVDNDDAFYLYSMPEFKREWKKFISLKDIIYVKVIDFNYDSINEFFIVSKNGECNIRTIKLSLLDEFSLFGENGIYITSNILFGDTDNDADYEIAVGGNKGVICLFKYVPRKKNFINVILDKMKNILF